MADEKKLADISTEHIDYISKQQRQRELLVNVHIVVLIIKDFFLGLLFLVLTFWVMYVYRTGGAL